MPRSLPLLLALALSPLVSVAQEYRATLLGVVTDASGAVVPGAALTITNIETGVVNSVKSNTDGSYLVAFLLPGQYSLRAEAPGFRTLTRSPIELRVNDRARIDVALQLGDVSERVTVTAETPLLETSGGSLGQVVGTKQVTDLPIDSGNPFSLMNIAAGVQFTGNMQYTRPFDNGAIADFSINGGRSGINEYQIDGVPNNANTGRNDLAYVPPAEATESFKVQTSTFDAQSGRTGGGVVSVSIKSGTNKPHGAVYGYFRRPRFEANSFANNVTGAAKVQRVTNRYGFEVDGPVVLPHLYKGKDRTFFMFAWEHYSERLPQPVIGAVPTAAQRQGDYSATLTASGALYTIYDPLTVAANPAYNPQRPVTAGNARNIRQAFAGNQIPKSRFEPIAVRVLQDIPLPNQPGDPRTGLNNWFANAFTLNGYNSLIGRVDHVLHNSWRMYARWHYSFRDGTRTDYWAWGTPATRQIHGNRRNDGAVLDTVGMLNPGSVLSLRLGFTRYCSDSNYQPVDVSSLGFPASLARQLQMPDKYPIIRFDSYLQTSGDEWNLRPSDTYTLQASWLRTAGPHALKIGGEFRLLHYADVGRTNGSGNYYFDRSWTRLSSDVDTPDSGNAVASFLMGYMTSAVATLNATPYLTWHYPVLYLQDDWQVSRRLSLNLGLRWDYESPPVERYNRQNRGFDANAVLPIKVAGMDAVRGGLLFAGVNGAPRGAFDADWNNIQPRAGLAYRLLSAKPLVFRAGAGRYFLPTVEFGGSTGFSQTTNSEISTEEGVAVRKLANPFPSGLVPRPGAGLGLMTQVGDSITFSDPRRTIPYVWQYSGGFQYEFRPGLLAAVSYVGSQTREVQVSKSLNALSVEQLQLGTSYLSTSVANPFYGVLAPNTARGSVATTGRRNLMVPYPQFSSVTMTDYSVGKSWYNSVQFKFEQRVRKGLSYLVSYTVSKTMEAASYLNAQDTALSRELTSFDVPQRLVVSGWYEIPGLPAKTTPLARRLLGRWQASWSTIFQSGTPISYPSYILLGNPKLDHPTLERWFDTSSSIWRQLPNDTLRTTPLRSPNIRKHTAPQVSGGIVRMFRVREGHSLQLKLYAYNATNTPIFGAPNTSPTSPLFGTVTKSQVNLPRSVELGIRYKF